MKAGPFKTSKPTILTTFQSTEVIRDPSDQKKKKMKNLRFLSFLEFENRLFNIFSDFSKITEIFKLFWSVSGSELVPFNP